MSERAEMRPDQNRLQSENKCCTLSPEREISRDELEEIERRLIPLLVAVQRALGKEPAPVTRTERRKR